MMETNETIQKAEQKPEKRAKKPRSPFDKEGSFKYLQRWLRRVEDKVDENRKVQWLIFDGLELGGYLLYDHVYIHEKVCTSEVDDAVLEELYSAGPDGRLPRDIAYALNKQFHTRYYQPWHVRYILRRMNNKLEKVRGQTVAEKHGMRWALTSFARKAWGLTKEEIIHTGEEVSN